VAHRTFEPREVLEAVICASLLGKQRQGRVQTRNVCLLKHRKNALVPDLIFRRPDPVPRQVYLMAKDRARQAAHTDYRNTSPEVRGDACIGFVTKVEPDEGELTCNFDERPVAYGFGELDTLVPAYAATIHKSQGSEYPAVVIPVMTQHYALLQRNFLYTGVTRGKRLVVLVGQKKAVAIAVRNVSGRRRWSKLQEWLRADVAKRHENA
jgi:UvrD-like helicase C-terminal domain